MFDLSELLACMFGVRTSRDASRHVRNDHRLKRQVVGRRFLVFGGGSHLHHTICANNRVLMQGLRAGSQYGRPTLVAALQVFKSPRGQTEVNQIYMCRCVTHLFWPCPSQSAGRSPGQRCTVTNVRCKANMETVPLAINSIAIRVRSTPRPCGPFDFRRTSAARRTQDVRLEIP